MSMYACGIAGLWIFYLFNFLRDLALKERARAESAAPGRHPLGSVLQSRGMGAEGTGTWTQMILSAVNAA